MELDGRDGEYLKRCCVGGSSACLPSCTVVAASICVSSSPIIRRSYHLIHATSTASTSVQAPLVFCSCSVACFGWLGPRDVGGNKLSLPWSRSTTRKCALAANLRLQMYWKATTRCLIFNFLCRACLRRGLLSHFTPSNLCVRGRGLCQASKAVTALRAEEDAEVEPNKSGTAFV